VVNHDATHSGAKRARPKAGKAARAKAKPEPNEHALRRLAAILEHSPDAIIEKRLDGTITSWNSGAEKTYGFAASEMIGKSVAILSPPECVEEIAEILDKVKEGDAVELETTRLTRNRKRIMVSLAAYPIRNRRGKVVGVSTIARNITERKRMEEALFRSEANFRSSFENSPCGLLRTATGGAILRANPAILKMLGYGSENELWALNMTDVYKDPAERARLSDRYLVENVCRDVETEWKCKDGTPITVRFSANAVKGMDGHLAYFEVAVEDVTERRSLDRQLRQSQKMEAIGRLSGGIAHDFNNLLCVIMGYAESLQERMEQNHALRKSADEILRAAKRAAALTGQLLAFSRQQTLDPRVLDLNHIVSDIQGLLRRVIGEDIQLSVALDPKLGRLKADPSQLGQVIMNLAVNARDAMPDGGKLTLVTQNFVMDDVFVQRYPYPVQPGPYVVLTVTDTGVGMSPATKARAFEPFFTTKEEGKGTGLGLSTVYGVVKQSGGYIELDSAPGAGTTFTIYLPRVEGALPPESAPFNDAIISGEAYETILLVEDEQALRTLVRGILESAGYTVLEASDGREALDLSRQYTGTIDLLLTDIVMPRISGTVLAEALEQQRPELRVLFISGYTGLTVGGKNPVEGRMYLAKPFSRQALARKVREALTR
jgi:two-component system cell cycle sensor histidine kinase/response regulator CckA